MKKLRRLTLAGTLITDDGMKYLRDLTDLEDLDLYGVKITDTGLDYLSKLTKLRNLNLLGAQITDAGADTLSHFTELRGLVLYRSRISDAGLAKLERLKNLARPHLGQWWELARMLVPALAMRGDARYGQLAEWLLGKTRDDLPSAAGLDSALLETLGKKKKVSARTR